MTNIRYEYDNGADYGDGEEDGGGEDDDDNDVVGAKVHLDDKLAVTTDSMKIGGNRNDDRQAGKDIG